MGARFYTAREAARLMGFPEHFRIPGHPTKEFGQKHFDAHEHFFQQIGNAVCPPVVQAVAARIIDALGVHNHARDRPVASPVTPNLA